MADKKKTRNIMCTVTENECNEILMYAQLKGHGGENPVPNLVHYAVFQYMRRYPLKPSEIEKYQQNTAKRQEASRVYTPNKPRANKKSKGRVK